MSMRVLFLAAVLLPLLAQPARQSAIIPGFAVSISSVAVEEGNSGLTEFGLAIIFYGNAPVEVDVAARGVEADDSDFMFAPVHLTLEPGEPGNLTGFIVGDRRFERDEQIQVWASIGGMAASEPGVVRIIDDDGDLAPRVSGGPFSTAEGNAGWWTLNVPVSLDRTLDGPLTIAYETMGGTPESPTSPWGDYRPARGAVTFAPGQQTVSVPVEVNGDAIWEPTSTFMVNLSTDGPAVIAAGSTVTLLNDDKPTAVTIEDVRTDEGQAGRHPVTMRATFAPSAPAHASVSVRVLGGTARAGEDFEGQTVQLVPPPGVTSVTFAVMVIGETTPECDEGVIVAYEAQGTGDQGLNEAKLLIVDDDGPRADAAACPDPFATRSEPAPVPDGGGAPPVARDADAQGGDAPADAAVPPSSGGCGCGLGGGGAAGGPAALALVAWVVLRRGRSRRGRG